MELKNFEELITPTLTDGQKYVSYECENLLPPGENYGSQMLKVQVNILNAENKEEVLHYIGKACPPSELLWEVFNTKVTFKKEIAVYSTIIPILNKYGKEKGIDCLINFITKFITARISLDPKSDEVDHDCLLLLENIKIAGYDVGDRFTGFDLDTSKLLLRDLATLHAVPIAFKLERPDDFEKKIRPYLNHDFNFPEQGDVIDTIIAQMQNAVKSNPNCVRHLSKIDHYVRIGKYNGDNPLEVNELYGTFVHNDYWVNNTMLKFIDGKPVKNKIIDFQIISYDSLAKDVIFFLYSSVQISVLEKHIDELMRFYYDVFIDTLNGLSCDTSKYTYTNMLEEFSRIANHDQFAHVLFMLLPMMTLKGKAKDLSEMKKVDDILTDDKNLHENYSKRMQFVLLDLAKRNWI